jgi:threonine aldolase
MTDDFEFDVNQDVEEVPASVGELQDMVEELILTVEQARGMPLSGNVSLDRNDFIERLRDLRERLPEELRTARWMVREREAFITQTNEQSAEIMRRAKDLAAQMVSETQVMTEAVEEANILVRNAEEQARVIRLESEDVAESTYEHVETLLGNLLERVRDRRAELHQARPAPPEVPISE